MSKFSSAPSKPKTPKFAPQPLGKTKGRTVTHEGGTGYAKGDKLALYTLAVTNMVGEPTFYESAKGRDNRFAELTHKVAVKDPEWIAGFIPFLRDTANMRSAAVVCAVEASRAILDAKAKGADIDVSVRRLISSACSRADEPAEVLGYWLSTYGRPVPPSIRRGIADAASKLYNEYAAMKYDGGSRGVRVGDVIDMVHPSPTAEWQSALFGYMLDRRHGRDTEVPEVLTKITNMRYLDSLPADQRRAVLRERGPEVLAEAGYTWERLGGWIPGGMDAEAWEAIIPSMGYMALLRNLRNFEENKVSKAVLKTVRDRLEDPEQVAKSRQFPYRFYSAYLFSGSTYFASALENALDLSCQNIPDFPGKTLVAVDVSGSMDVPISRDTKILRHNIGALFASAVANKSRGDVTTIAYGTNWKKMETKVSVLRMTETIHNAVKDGSIGWGTNTWPSVRAAWQQFGPFDRVCIFTDMQDHPSRASQYDVPANVPIYVWDLAGYKATNLDISQPGRYLLGGFTDATFRLIPLLEAGNAGNWPWLV